MGPAVAASGTRRIVRAHCARRRLGRTRARRTWPPPTRHTTKTWVHTRLQAHRDSCLSRNGYGWLIPSCEAMAATANRCSECPRAMAGGAVARAPRLVDLADAPAEVVGRDPLPKAALARRSTDERRAIRFDATTAMIFCRRRIPRRRPNAQSTNEAAPARSSRSCEGRKLAAPPVAADILEWVALALVFSPGAMQRARASGAPSGRSARKAQFPRKRHASGATWARRSADRAGGPPAHGRCASSRSCPESAHLRGPCGHPHGGKFRVRCHCKTRRPQATPDPGRLHEILRARAWRAPLNSRRHLRGSTRAHRCRCEHSRTPSSRQAWSPSQCATHTPAGRLRAAGHGLTLRQPTLETWVRANRFRVRNVEMREPMRARTRILVGDPDRAGGDGEAVRLGRRDRAPE